MAKHAIYQRIVGTTPTAISNGPVRILGVFANVGSTGTITVADGATDIVDVSATAGVASDIFGALFSNAISTGSAAGTDVTVIFERYPG